MLRETSPRSPQASRALLRCIGERIRQQGSRREAVLADQRQPSLRGDDVDTPLPSLPLPACASDSDIVFRGNRWVHVINGRSERTITKPGCPPRTRPAVPANGGWEL